jgi:hypothetical protein
MPNAIERGFHSEALSFPEAAMTIGITDTRCANRTRGDEILTDAPEPIFEQSADSAIVAHMHAAGSQQSGKATEYSAPSRGRFRCL